MRKNCVSFSVACLFALSLGGCAGHPNDEFGCHESCAHYPKMQLVPHCPVGDPDPRWDNLVLQGGGVKGIAYGGALKVLDSSGYLEPIQNVAGTSAGAITAALLALGYNSCEVAGYAKNYPYEDLKDGRGPGEIPRLIEQYGVYKGDFFHCSMRCLAEQTLGEKSASFETLASRIKNGEQNDLGRDLKYLHVVATDVSTEDDVTFSHESTYAKTPIAEAVRKSMSIPLFFRAQTLSEDGRDHVFVDGGVVRNYPINMFDNPADPDEFFLCILKSPNDPGSCGVNMRTLGLHLSEGRRDYYKIDDIIGFTEQLFHTLAAAQIDLLCAAPYDVRRTVFIDSYEIKATDFDLTTSQIECLLDSGRRHMQRFLENGPEQSCPGFIQPESREDIKKCLTNLAPPDSVVGID